MNKKKANVTGQLTEITVMQKLVELGWHVARPFSDACYVDLLVLDEYYNAYKLQVKTAYPTNTGFRLKFTKPSSKETYNSYEVDYFATVFNDKLYMVPFSVVNNRKSCCFHLAYLNDPKLYAKTYEFMSVSEKQPC